MPVDLNVLALGRQPRPTDTDAPEGAVMEWEDGDDMEWETGETMEWQA